MKADKKEKIEIQITFNENNYEYLAAVAPNRHIQLISFNYWNGYWEFYTYWIPRMADASVKIPGGFGDEFPMEQFTKLIQARYMMATGALDFPEVVLSKTAKKVLTQEYRKKALAYLFK